MKLLIVTQKVDANDHNLGFFTRWIEALATQCESVLVVCLEQGTYALPPNVQVLSLGKDRLKIKDVRFKFEQRVWYICRLVRYIVLERGNYDAVFVHMNPEYALVGGLMWKLLGKKTALWYVHKAVTWRLRLAALLVDKVFTASPESCRLRSKKIEVIGHGIDSNTNYESAAADTKLRKYTTAKAPHLITAGRISSVKDIRTLIFGFLELQKRFPGAIFSIVGEPITDSDRAYLAELRRISSDVRFLGGVTHNELPRLLREATAFVHASRTGGMDKAVLEALAAELPVLTSSEVFSGVIPGVVKFREGDPHDLAEKLVSAYERGEFRYNEAGRQWVRGNHSLDTLVTKIVAFYSGFPLSPHGRAIGL